MIKSLSIQNFQSHKDTELEFDPGCNVIVGSSDSGKTAILRALRWLIWNRPSGDSIRSNWGGETKVILETEVGIVTRRKDKKDSYSARLKGLLTEVVFEAFGTSVPKEIQDALNMSDINMQQQLDQPFLLTETPGAVSQHFNKIARLDQIDSGLQNVQRWIRELEQDIKYKDGQLTEQETALQAYEYLDKMESEVEVLEDMEKALQAKETRKQRLLSIINDYLDNQEDLKAYEEILSDEKLVNQILQFIEDRAEIDIKEVKLERLVDKIKDVRDEIREYEEVLGLEDQVSSLLKLERDKNELIMENDPSKLRHLIRKITTANHDYEMELIQLDGYVKQFDKEMGEICLLCGQPIKR